MSDSNKVAKARKYAIHCHTSTNHKYDGKPYSYHLESVVDYALRFIHLIPRNKQLDVLSACWCHDVIEDCRQTYPDVKENTNENVANIVYALTNEKGKTREERANDKYYEGIRETPYATFVKLCDRMANLDYSKRKSPKMTKVYLKDMSNFIKKIYDPKYDEMFDYLKKEAKS